MATRPEQRGHVSMFKGHVEHGRKAPPPEFEASHQRVRADNHPSNGIADEGFGSRDSTDDRGKAQ